ncbi:RusA family crossover junction endodeoxyribonuclease [Enterococcus sp. DIV0240a]|uniref:RusA family crossover junction endodeoxyribonuclease n=1 Tax=unclassified Enterococcus TaxID=2608891 RepID=UPI003D2C9902
MKVVILGELTDLNKFINSQRTNRYVGAKLKKQNTEKCRDAFLLAKATGFKVPIPFDLQITWYCKNKRKDKDNTSFGIKFILDGMIEAGIIQNDGWGEVNGFEHRFEVDKENPRIEIEVKEKC